VIETKKKIAILTVAVAALALTAFIAPASAVDIGNHTITFMDPHIYNSENCISRWTYEVTTSSQQGEGLSHWVMDWCNASALVVTGCSEHCEYVIDDHETGITGIKFDTGYLEGETRTVWFELKGCGDYNEEVRYVGTKAGHSTDYGWVTGPIGLPGDPCAPVPELPTIILLSVGLLTLAGYVGLRRKKE